MFALLRGVMGMIQMFFIFSPQFLAAFSWGRAYIGKATQCYSTEKS